MSTINSRVYNDNLRLFKIHELPNLTFSLYKIILKLRIKRKWLICRVCEHYKLKTLHRARFIWAHYK